MAKAWQCKACGAICKADCKEAHTRCDDSDTGWHHAQSGWAADRLMVIDYKRPVRLR